VQQFIVRAILQETEKMKTRWIRNKFDLLYNESQCGGSRIYVYLRVKYYSRRVRIYYIKYIYGMCIDLREIDCEHIYHVAAATCRRRT